MKALPQLEGYFADRWHARVALRVLLWRDMVAVGTLVNLLTGFVALMLLAQGLNEWAVAVHFVPIPFNAFLLAAVWRLRQRTSAASIVAGLWFVAMLVV